MKYLLLAGTLLTVVYSEAQSKKFSFKLGEEYELPKKNTDIAFFGNDKDGIVNLSLKKEELDITRFNAKNLSKTMEQKIDLDVTKNFNSEEVTSFANSNSYYWIHSDWDKGAEKEMLYYDKIDIIKGKIAEGNHKMLESTKMAGAIANGRGLYSYKLVGKYKFDYDVDRKKLLVSYRLAPEERNDKKNYDKIGLFVFDENMNKIWGGEFRMPYTEAIMDNADYAVDNKGNAYLLAKVYDSDARKEKDKETGKPGYHFEVFKFAAGSKDIIKTPLVHEDYYVHETSLIENPNHDMVIACTYSKKSKGNGTDGIFLATMGEDGKITKFKNGYYEFPVAELAKFESARNQRKMENKDDYEIPNLKVRDVMIEADGGIFITCEEYYWKYVWSKYGGYFVYYYEDIYGARIDATGKFEWIRKIPKRQRGENPRGTMGFKLIADGTGYYFLYLDNLKNLALPENEVPKYHVDGYGGQVMVTKIDLTGKVSKELLFDTREEDIMIFPADFSKINNNQFIGRAKLKKTLFQPLLITVK